LLTDTSLRYPHSISAAPSGLELHFESLAQGGTSLALGYFLSGFQPFHLEPSHVGCYGFVLNCASIFRRTSSLILINGGHGLLNPSPASLRVASIPSFEPIAISEVAWSRTSAGPLVKIESRWGSVFAHRRNSTSLVL
jgi:hypothetical protein